MALGLLVVRGCKSSLGNFTDGETGVRNGTVTSLSTFTGICRAGTSLGMTPEWKREVGRARGRMVPTPLIHLNSDGCIGSLRTTTCPGHRLRPRPPPSFESLKNPASSSHSSSVGRTSYFALKKWVLTCLHIIRENGQPRSKPPLLFMVRFPELREMPCFSA